MKVWKIVPVDESLVAQLSRESDIPPPLARVLVGRGLADGPKVTRFLNPRLSDLSDPMLLPDMERAVARVWEALERRQRIAVYGDYDADGVIAAGLLVRVLGRLGAEAVPSLPSRHEEGYGLSEEAFRGRVLPCCPELLITADCGTSDAKGVAAARSHGVDVIVTDHHEVSAARSEPLALVNPKLGNDSRTRGLAGVGVAFKLCHAILKKGRERGNAAAAGLDLREYLEWVAVGTVADVVPMLDENRIFVRHGLSRLNDTAHCGLRMLMDRAGVRRPVTAWQVAFIVGPRLNAAGRMGDARRALDLMLTEDAAAADNLASELEEANRERRALERDIAGQAMKSIDGAFDPGRDFGIVIGQEGWHAGVIGIVAQRICSAYNRPTVVVAFDESGNGRGSCRSIPEFDVVQGLGECAGFLERFGGHRAAAGLTVRRERFESFRERFNSLCRDGLAGCDLRPVQRIDAWVDLRELSPRFVETLDGMHPFGEGNPAPVWGVRCVRVAGKPRVLQNEHLKMCVAQGGTQMEAIAFGMAHREIPSGPIDMAVAIEKNNYGGRETLQLKVQDFRPAE